MKAIAFDLGDTLVEYAGLPPSWVEHYPDCAALRSLSAEDVAEAGLLDRARLAPAWGQHRTIVSLAEL